MIIIYFNQFLEKLIKIRTIYYINNYMSNKCYSCTSIIDNGIIHESNYYCSDKCYSDASKKCEFCLKQFNIINTPCFLNEPYYFCSIKHMFLANPRIRFGVIGGPVGGDLGPPAIIIEQENRLIPKYIAPAPSMPSPPESVEKQPNMPSPPEGVEKQPSMPSPPKGVEKQPSMPFPPPGFEKLPSMPFPPPGFQPLKPLYQPFPPSMPSYQVNNSIPIFRPYPMSFGKQVVFF